MCCARRFKLSRRRHHCRVCGEVCCARCAPKRLDASTGRSQRTCERCVARGPPRVNLSLARQQPPPSAHSSPLSASASGPSTPSTSPSPFAGGGGGLTPPVADSHGPGGGGGGGGMSHAALLEVYIEDALHRLALCWYGLRAASIGLTLLLLATAFVHAAGWRGRAAVAATAAGLVPLRPFVLRYYRIVWLCAVVSWRVGCASLAVRGRSAAAADALWEMTHRVNARFVYDTVASLGGFWVKLAQATSVSSALPEVYKLELAQLQDAMPADDLPSVHRLLEAELGPEWRSSVKLYDGPPLGSATIAQVHRARLRVVREGGRVEEVEGVVKVQHRHVERSLLIDIGASQIVALLASFAFPHLFQDMRVVVKDLSVLTRAELDFRIEAQSQATARELLAASELGGAVFVPEVFPALATRRVLGMEYVEGENIKEVRRRGASELEVTRIVTALVDAFSLTMHGEIFNCDPHPGNLLVETATGRLAVLDWGQARRLSPAERTAYTRLFMAVAMEDTLLMREACADL
ncbi:ABC1 family protein, partial [Emiliania huxleyi CCMP1516]|uniref:Uncharacterized protein n=3 Tax=Emiliania huxleyi TaxID=2903 RepID=A0A0D3JUH6_EMIH1